MKKIFFILPLLLCFGFVGCSQNSGQNSDQNLPETNSSNNTQIQEDVVLTVWESSQGPDMFIQQAGEKFSQIHPNIKIKYVNVESVEASTRIALDGPSGVGPDLFSSNHDRLGELMQGGHILPAQNPDKSFANVLPMAKSALTYDNITYGYPVSAETYALFYNKDLIQEADVPKTWEDLKNFAKNFNDNDKYGFMMDVGNAYYTIIFTTSQDNKLFGPLGTDTTNTNINSPHSIEGMQIFSSLREILNVPSADMNTATGDSAFASGKVALYITGLWNVKPFEEAGINFGTTTLPSLPGNNTPALSFSGVRGMFVSAYSNYPQEANLFAEFLMTDEIQKLRYEITQTLPAISVEIQNPTFSGFLEQLNYSFPMPSIPLMANFWEKMNSASKNIWDGAEIKSELDACNNAILEY